MSTEDGEYIKPSRTQKIKHLDKDDKPKTKKVHRVGKAREPQEHVSTGTDWVRYYEEESGIGIGEKLDQDPPTTGEV